ncbi:MAG: putative flavoprotein [Rhodobacteraceae bacterium HLUCCA08]|nr:MAG: putative flavoprotein [Rhodobacteraceae bacterium HLUCCA08]
MSYLFGISGALRAASTNTMLLHEAARLYGPDRFETGDLRLPLYDADLEAAEGIPAAVRHLAEQIAGAEAVVIATPEYNKAPPGVLKNALDWVSRVKGNPWADKPVAIMSAAAGRAGGERSQFALRLMMNAFRPRLLYGPEVMIGNSSQHFDAEGRLTDDMAVKLLGELMDQLKAVARG